MTSISSKCDGYYKKKKEQMHKYGRKLISIVYRQIHLHKQYGNTKREINVRVRRWMDKTLNRIIFYVYISETNN
jgi:hypothetical protein